MLGVQEKGSVSILKTKEERRKKAPKGGNSPVHKHLKFSAVMGCVSAKSCKVYVHRRGDRAGQDRQFIFGARKEISLAHSYLSFSLFTKPISLLPGFNGTIRKKKKLLPFQS